MLDLSLTIHPHLVQLNEELADAVTTIRAFNGLAEYLGPVFLQADGMRLSELERCVLFVEDRLFFLHTGLGWKSLARLPVRRIKGKPIGAVSTIDQQVVRIALDRYDRTFSRKWREVVLALALNARLSKSEILTYYLNSVYCGYGLKGLGVAALTIFGEEGFLVRDRQCAFLTALLALPMPRVVYEQVVAGHIDFLRGVDFGLHQAESLAPRWVGRVRWRTNHAMGYKGFRPIRR